MAKQSVFKFNDSGDIREDTVESIDERDTYEALYQQFDMDTMLDDMFKLEQLRNADRLAESE